VAGNGGRSPEKGSPVLSDHLSPIGDDVSLPRPTDVFECRSQEPGCDVIASMDSPLVSEPNDEAYESGRLGLGGRG